MSMASSAVPRGVKRVLQACENCRRKKTRCPGEKPNCSTCTRLQQSCLYPGHDIDEGSLSSKHGRSLENRLAHLEDKLERLVGGTDESSSPSRRETSPAQVTIIESNIVATPSTANISSLGPISTLPREVLLKAIDIYFRCSHRQPIWLFGSKDELTPSSPEEVLLAILGISAQYQRPSANDVCLQTVSNYNNAARNLIMLKIGQSTVDMATLQALCLLSFSNLVSGELQLASFHVSLVGNLLQCSGLDRHISQDRTRKLEEQRRLFWSVRTVEVLCGLPKRMPSLLDIEAPQYLILEETLRKASGHAPLLPQEIYNTSGDAALGIWAHMARSANLWSQVRSYVWSCATGEAKTPWLTDSGYTSINSQLLDMECGFPTSYRYDSAKFSERSSEELNKKRDFWLPWMKVQITYHTLHSVMNHPFLYSARASRPKPGPNAFWKTSTDLALLHSTWIARLIGMASKKGLVLADPFFAHAAAVAITLHVYWSRAASSKIRTPAEANLEVCRSFLAEIGAHWPVCHNIAEDIETLITLSSSAANPDPEPADTVSAHTGIMWKLLDFASSRHSPMGQSIFQTSWETDLRTGASDHEHVTLEDPQVNSPPGDLQTTTGAYAPPPDWFSPLTVTSPHASRQRNVHAAGASQTDLSMPSTDHPALQHGYDASAWAWGPGDPQAALDPWTQFYGRAGPEPGWYDYGNL